VIRQALWILRKDIRHLWPRAAVFVALAVAYANGDAATPRQSRLEGPGMLGFALWLAAAFVVVSVIHDDRLVGDRQFWLTRPYSWKSLALAKLLFVLVFVSLPVLLAQIAELVANGLSPAEYAPQLLWRQCTLAAWTIFPCAALAAVTRNLVQVIVTGLALEAAFLLVLFESFNLGASGAPAPVDEAGHAAIAMLLAGLACGWQFSRRGVFTARCLFVCGLGASVTLFPIVPWSAAFVWLSWRSPAVDPAVVRLAPDSLRRVAGGWGYGTEGGQIQMFFPIQVTGIPDGMIVRSERVKIVLRAPGGNTWSSGWSDSGEVTNSSLRAVGVHQLLPGAGAPYWLVADVDQSFYDAFSSKPVQVHGEAAFTLLGRASTTPLTASEKPQPIAGHGFCYPTRQQQQFAGALCIAPFRYPSYSALRVQPPAPNAISGGPGFSGFGMGRSPGETVFSIWEDNMLSNTAPPAPYEVSIETRPEVAHFTRAVDMPGVVLAELRGQ
jgi:hypothetical protein